MSKLFSAALFTTLLLISFGLSIFALGLMYWAAGAYFGWTLVLSVTAMSVVAQYLILRTAYGGNEP